MRYNRFRETNIHKTALIFPKVKIARRTSIGEYSLVGKPYRPVNGKPLPAKSYTRIGQECHIGSFVIVGKGSTISDKCMIDNGVQIEQDVSIGKETLVIYRSQICNYARIGSECKIGGFVCENAKIGDRVRMFGTMIHAQKEPTSDWDLTDEPAPVIRRDSFVGFGALIIGGIEVGPNSLVCAGAVVTKKVPPCQIVRGIDCAISAKEWSGSLRDSAMFKGRCYE